MQSARRKEKSRKTDFLATAGPQPPRQRLQRRASEEKCAEKGRGRREEKNLLQKQKKKQETLVSTVLSNLQLGFSSFYSPKEAEVVGASPEIGASSEMWPLTPKP